MIKESQPLGIRMSAARLVGDRWLSTHEKRKTDWKKERLIGFDMAFFNC